MKILDNLNKLFFLFFFVVVVFYAKCLFPTASECADLDIFSKTFFKLIECSTTNENNDSYIWECNAVSPFTELILSWNAFRPDHGNMTFFVNVKHCNWSGWQRIAEWSSGTQRTFVNKLNPYVHTKHVRVEMQRGVVAKGFKIKVVFRNGASIKNLKALFVCLSDLKKFKTKRSYHLSLSSVLVKGVPCHSQMVLNHPRFRDLCAPTSMGLISEYFNRKYYGTYQPNLSDYLVEFADKVHDNGYLDIYGSWPLNVAQAYDATNGDVFFRVERLNCFNDLYRYISNDIPVAVSVRKLRGGATSYKNGHYMVVVGWDQRRQTVLCIDPAFSCNSQTPKAYKLCNFLCAWGRSNNLAYVPIPKDNFHQFI